MNRGLVKKILMPQIQQNLPGTMDVRTIREKLVSEYKKAYDHSGGLVVQYMAEVMIYGTP